MGFAALTRGDALFYLPGFVAATYASTSISGSLIKRVVLISLPMMLVVAPWYARNAALIDPGVGLSTTAGINFYFAHNPDSYGRWPDGSQLRELDPVEANLAGFAAGFDYIQERPGHLLSNLSMAIKQLSEASGYAVTWSTAADMSLVGDEWVYTSAELPWQSELKSLSLSCSSVVLALVCVAVASPLARPPCR